MKDQHHHPVFDYNEQQIRVLHIVSTFEIKTDTKWLLQLLSHLSGERIHAAIACMYNGGEMMEKFAHLGIPVFNFNAPGKISPKALIRAYRVIGSFGPHIVHTHLLRADLYGALAARLAGVPVVLSTVYAIGQYRREKTRRLDGLLDKLCKLFAKDILAVSDAVGEDVMKRLNWPPDCVNTVHTGINFPTQLPDAQTAAAARRQWAIPESAPLVLTTARLSYEKGIDILIRAASSVHSRLPSAHFVVLGEGPLRKQLEAQIADHGLQDVFHLPGFYKDIPGGLAAADLFVLPSLMEGMPNAILEAYAAGRPVIATRAGGSAEAVEHEHSGLLVPPNDPDAMASTILRCLTDSDLRKRLAQTGQQWAQQRFSVQRVAERYERLYEQLIEKHTTHNEQIPIGKNIEKAPANT